MAGDKEREDGKVFDHTGWPDGVIHTPEGEDDRRQAEGEEPPAIAEVQKTLGPSFLSTDQYFAQNRVLRRLKKLGVE